MSDQVTYKFTNKILIIQVSEELANNLIEISNEGGLIDFDDLPEDSFKILSTLSVSGPAEIQA